MSDKYININYPFKDSVKGFFLDLNSNEDKAIKSDLMHLILTNKGERFYNPDFGTNLMRYIFEPKDGYTFEQIRGEIIEVVRKYLPNLTINKVIVEPVEESEYVTRVRIDYTINKNVFEKEDFIEIQI